jgi:hypothetical protein
VGLLLLLLLLLVVHSASSVAAVAELIACWPHILAATAVAA